MASDFQLIALSAGTGIVVALLVLLVARLVRLRVKVGRLQVPPSGAPATCNQEEEEEEGTGDSIAPATEDGTAGQRDPDAQPSPYNLQPSTAFDARDVDVLLTVRPPDRRAFTVGEISLQAIGGHLVVARCLGSDVIGYYWYFEALHCIDTGPPPAWIPHG
ncbi:MAG: hypothetical protein M5U01_10290 [Ardenticatenaceae bacterium]|nr:hypothetical protein [Ardenticatenaceae bacterium]